MTHKLNDRRGPSRRLIYWHEVDRGVTSVWEPELFPAEIRAVFRSLRQLNPTGER